MHRPLLTLVILGLAALPARAAEPAVDWPVLQAAPIVTGASNPTYIANAGDGTGRLFVVQHPGQVLLVSGSTLSSTPFLDISGEVFFGSAKGAGMEQGLLSIAFPPGYASKGHFYAAYSRVPDGAVVLSRFSLTSDPNAADPASEQVLLTIPETPGQDIHSGGQLQFGPDGFLYMSRGDAGPQGDADNHGQNLGVLLGKLLRLDVEGSATPYGIPGDNPFVHKKNARPEIWARGLRNPWRFSFDRQTGDLYIGDVGQDRYEEADFQPAGKGGVDYGWRLREGTHRFDIPPGFPAAALDSLTPPISQQSHPTATAIIGGYVYRGSLSKRMAGIYFYADYGSGSIWGVTRLGHRWVTSLLLTTGNGISTFGEDESGELYYADYNAGVIYQLQDTGAAWTPTILPDGGSFPKPGYAIVRSQSPGAVIHYTLTGVDPTAADPAVPANGRVLINASATLKARAFRADLQPSGVASAAFTLP